MPVIFVTADSTAIELKRTVPDSRPLASTAIGAVFFAGEAVVEVVCGAAELGFGEFAGTGEATDATPEGGFEALTTAGLVPRVGTVFEAVATVRSMAGAALGAPDTAGGLMAALRSLVGGGADPVRTEAADGVAWALELAATAAPVGDGGLPTGAGVIGGTLAAVAFGAEAAGTGTVAALTAIAARVGGGVVGKNFEKIFEIAAGGALLAALLVGRFWAARAVVASSMAMVAVAMPAERLHRSILD